MKITLVTDTQLFAAALSQTRVTIYDTDGRIADYGGVIERYSLYSIRIGGAYYMRSNFVFCAG
jgi:hypothetical protein